jgi:electron transfer flavoprotein alpha subunit
VPRLAQETGAAHLPEAIGFEAGDGGLRWDLAAADPRRQDARASAGARRGGRSLVTLQSGRLPGRRARDGRRGGPEPGGRLAGDRPRPRDPRRRGGGRRAVDLDPAEVIVAVGRGIGGADKMAPIEELAARWGRDRASRPVIDSGWLPRDRQIGSSGQTVAPKLYVALGISGAIQHLVGMKGAGCVVAINKDPSAPIFKVARYGIVGDLHEVVPAISAVLREAED